MSTADNPTMPPRRGAPTTGAERQASRIPPPPPTDPVTTSGRAQAVAEMLAIPLIPLSVMATKETIGKPEGFISPYTLDIATIQMYTPQLANGIADLANSYPALGVVLDRLAATTPFAGLLTTLIAVTVQLAENHGVLPETAQTLSPGLIPRQDFARQLHEAGKEKAAMSNGH